MTLDPDRRAALLAAKLGVLVRGRWDDVGDEVVTAPFPSGATLAHPASGRMWILLDEGGERRLGACLAVAARRDVRELHVIVGDDGVGSVLARQAQLFAAAPQVWIERSSHLELADAAPPPWICRPRPRPSSTDRCWPRRVWSPWSRAGT